MEKINLQSMAMHRSCVYKNSSLALSTDLGPIMKSIDEVFYIEGVLVVLMKKGHVSVMIDGETSDFYEGDVFCCRPNVMVENAMVSIDMDAVALFISPDYAFDLVCKSGIDWTSLLISRTKESVHLTDDQMVNLNNFFSLLQTFIESPETEHKEQRIFSMMLTLIYTLCDMVPLINKEVHNQSYSPKENLMERFLKMLRDSQPNAGKGQKYLSVTEYAERLNVTPKYFSMVCKNMMGKSAGQIINEEIIRSAEVLLHDNSLSIKQIAQRLGFQNQSHFGTFFRRHTGSSPIHYRSDSDGC